ncbi:MAG: GDSL-type esterase/lipase family protein [bacterium]
MNSICIFGDSTAWGAWDLEKGGWVNRLWLFIAEKDLDCDVYNLSISGGTSETILTRFEAEAKIREADALIFQTGGNDASREHQNGNHCVAPDKFKSNLKEIIKGAKNITDNIIFIGFKNCDESKTTPVSWRNIFYTNKDIETYNQIIKEVCEKNNILFLDIFGILNNGDFDDGLHPNATGHKKLFIKIRDFLIANKWI